MNKLSFQIADVLFGSRKIRCGHAPTDDESGFMASMVDSFVNLNRPVDLVTLWGAIKCYGMYPQTYPDDAERLGLDRFLSLHRCVSLLYEPGLRVKIIREDVGETLLNTHCRELDERIYQYCKGLDSMVMGYWPIVRFVNESELLRRLGYTTQQFKDKAKTNAETILRYLVDSEGVPDERKGQLKTYHTMVSTGWNGIIPDVQRQHYLERVKSEYPDASHWEKLRHVATYFGCTLARGQLGMFKGDPQPLKASFVPHPPGTSVGSRLGRLEYKLKDSKNSNNHTPPWCGFAQNVRGEIHVTPHNHSTEVSHHAS